MPEGISIMDDAVTKLYLMKHFGISTAEQLDEKIRYMKKIDIGMFVGKDGTNESRAHRSAESRRTKNRQKANKQRV